MVFKLGRRQAFELIPRSSPVSFFFSQADRNRLALPAVDERHIVGLVSPALKTPDVISFVIGLRAFGNIRNRSIGQFFSMMKMA
jgi:hypothetical protein